MLLDITSTKKRCTNTQIVQKSIRLKAAQHRVLWSKFTIPVILALNAVTANSTCLFFAKDHPKRDGHKHLADVPFTEMTVNVDPKYGSPRHERLLTGFAVDTLKPRRRTGPLLWTHRMMQFIKKIGEEKVKKHKKLKMRMFYPVWYALVHIPMATLCWLWDKTPCFMMIETFVSFFYAKTPLFYNEKTKTTFELDIARYEGRHLDDSDCEFMNAIKETKLDSGWNVFRSVFLGILYILAYIGMFFANIQLTSSLMEYVPNATMRFFVVALICNASLLAIDLFSSHVVSKIIFKKEGVWSDAQWRHLRFGHPDDVGMLFEKDSSGNYKYVKEKKQRLGRWSQAKIDKCEQKRKKIQEKLEKKRIENENENEKGGRSERRITNIFARRKRRNAFYNRPRPSVTVDELQPQQIRKPRISRDSAEEASVGDTQLPSRDDHHRRVPAGPPPPRASIEYGDNPLPRYNTVVSVPAPVPVPALPRLRSASADIPRPRAAAHARPRSYSADNDRLKGASVSQEDLSDASHDKLKPEDHNSGDSGVSGRLRVSSETPDRVSSDPPSAKAA